MRQAISVPQRKQDPYPSRIQSPPQDAGAQQNGTETHPTHTTHSSKYSRFNPPMPHRFAARRAHPAAPAPPHRLLEKVEIGLHNGD